MKTIILIFAIINLASIYAMEKPDRHNNPSSQNNKSTIIQTYSKPAPMSSEDIENAIQGVIKEHRQKQSIETLQQQNPIISKL